MQNMYLHRGKKNTNQVLLGVQNGENSSSLGLRSGPSFWFKICAKRTLSFGQNKQKLKPAIILITIKTKKTHIAQPMQLN